jgi:hypothetical protein
MLVEPEVFEAIDVLSECDPVSSLAGRQGVFAEVLGNANLSSNSHEGSELASSDFFEGFRHFASLFEFCERNDTHAADLPTSSRRKLAERQGGGALRSTAAADDTLKWPERALREHLH